MITAQNTLGRLGLGVVVTGFILALLFSYAVIIDPMEYAGYYFEVSSYYGLAFGIALAILPVAYLPHAEQRPSALATYLLYFLVYIPSCIIPYCTAAVGGDGLWAFQLVLAVSLWMVSCSSRLPLIAIPNQALPKTIFWCVILGVFALAWCAVLMNFGLQIRWILFEEVYDVRADFVDALGQHSRALVYLVPWLANVIGPFLFVFSLRNRRWLVAALVAAAQVLAYTTTGYKHVLFSIIFLILLYAVLQFRRGTLLGRLAVACFLLVAVCAALDVASGNVLWTTLMTRRLFLNSGLLTGFYYDFFSVNPKLCLSHSIFRFFLDQPYSTAAPLLIGETYISSGCHANGHVWADAFANFGLPGMIVFSAGLTTLLWFYDCIARGCDHLLTTLVLAIPAMVLANTALLTTILTHGLGLAVMLVFFAPRELLASNTRSVPNRQSSSAPQLPLAARSRWVRTP